MGQNLVNVGKILNVLIIRGTSLRFIDRGSVTLEGSTMSRQMCFCIFDHGNTSDRVADPKLR